MSTQTTETVIRQMYHYMKIIEIDNKIQCVLEKFTKTIEWEEK